MRAFDHDYVVEVVRRVERVKPFANPAWGTLTPPEMVGHLVETLRYSMGRGEPYEDVGSWFTKHVLRRLLRWGLLRIPKNIQAPRAPGMGPRPRPSDSETLHAVLEEYLGLVQAGELTPVQHPILGNLDVDEWARLHVLHTEHHLRQFGV
ncbi:MAG: DUF1569 domain-containing protein [Candidatus Hydrogenedentales bacterium]|jgi:oxepin-CoA hydrolase/3-oxo-5,6-dehydrosuberyl-CoA semialdehyde dehydrogenase